MRPCPYCAEKIQDAAIKCKHCGAMLDATPALRREVTTPSAREPVKVLMEQTSKHLKLQYALASLLAIVGLVWMIVPAASGNKPASPVAAVLFLVGVGWYLVSRVRIWWNHD